MLLFVHSNGWHHLSWSLWKNYYRSKGHKLVPKKLPLLRDKIFIHFRGKSFVNVNLKSTVNSSPKFSKWSTTLLCARTGLGSIWTWPAQIKIHFWKIYWLENLPGMTITSDTSPMSLIDACHGSDKYNKAGLMDTGLVFWIEWNTWSLITME